MTTKIVPVTADNLDKLNKLLTDGEGRKIILAPSVENFRQGIPLLDFIKNPLPQISLVGFVLKGICAFSGKVMYFILDQNSGLPMCKTSDDDQHLLRGWREITRNGNVLKLYMTTE